MVRQAIHLQPMEVHGGADIHLQLVEDPTLEQVDMPCSPWIEAHTGAVLLSGPVTVQGDPCWSRLFLKDCTLWKGTMLEKLMKDSILWEGPHAGAREDYEEEGVTETKCYELTPTPTPHGATWGMARMG
ncbi:hypothetical protein llap_7896 [Limosa lapponica baueri]|uniref:Uncharacterized protein n=1 Tax=Limosa lapponica baueri TaxID=1758121 RepID=A0A2I0U6X8_LIMLA|nr:hypothetical protein llap_7896 [Limosa lapponica baueri]